MPAGDLITGSWQFELRTTLMGDGTNYGIDRLRGAIRGLVDVAVKESESEYAHDDGSFAGDGHQASRMATFALEVIGSTATAAGDNVETMRTVWAPSTTDLPLYFQLPGFGKRYVNGRPRGLIADYSTADFGVIPILASFRITDPTIYT